MKSTHSLRRHKPLSHELRSDWVSKRAKREVRCKQKSEGFGRTSEQTSDWPCFNVLLMSHSIAAITLKTHPYISMRGFVRPSIDLSRDPFVDPSVRPYHGSHCLFLTAVFSIEWKGECNANLYHTHTHAHKNAVKISEIVEPPWRGIAKHTHTCAHTHARTRTRARGRN